MSYFEEKPTGPTVQHDIELIEYLDALLKVKYRIFIIAVLVSGLVFGYSKTVDDLYSSSALLAININEKPGGFKPGDYRGNDVLGLIEHDFLIDPVADNEKERLIARLKSYAFVERFVKKFKVEEYIYAEYWDEKNATWVAGFQPDMRTSIIYFISQMLQIKLDLETGLLHIGVKSKNGSYSASLANKYWKDFNQYVRESDSKELERRREYLESRITQINNIELQKSIYRLMESQIASESLLYSREHYPLEEIQSATEPLYKSYPNRKVWTLLSFVGSAIIGIFVSLLLVLYKKISAAVQTYRLENEDSFATTNKNIEKLEPDSERLLQENESDTLKSKVKSSDVTASLDDWVERN